MRMSHNTSPIIQATGLVKRYGKLTAVGGIDFAIYPGECFGMLGPNGAGKTTSIRMLCCVSPVTEGTLTVAGYNVERHGRAIKNLLGVVTQEDSLDPNLTVYQNLVAYARYFRIPHQVASTRIQEALELFQLQEKRDSVIDHLSGGMKRRLLVARALLNEPSILVLDEPTTGLDPQARHLVWQKLRLLRNRGITMLLTTHYMDEASYLCDRVVIMDRGRILVEGTPQELVARYVGQEVLEVRSDGQSQETLLQRLTSYGMEVEDAGDVLYAYGDGSLQRELDLADASVQRRSANLEDVFLRLTGRELRDE